MTADPTPRPDPREFPSETVWLLALLAAAVLVNAWFVAGWLASPGGGTGGSARWIQLVMLVAPGPAIYVYYARWRMRRAVPLDGASQAGAGRTVDELAAAAGVTRRLRVRTDPRLGARAYVAGLADRPCLVLGPELLAVHDLGPGQRGVFEAVVRHELAHLRGGDLRWYQVATALRATNVYTAVWLLFVLVLALSVGEGSAGQLVVAALRAAGLVVLAEAIARAFLRVREHHADLRAATAGVHGLLAALAGGREHGAVRAWLRRHPGAGRRRAALVEPGVLLASAPGQILLGAATGGALLVATQELQLANASLDPTDTTSPVGLLVGIPLTLFVAFTVWRAVWHATTAGGSARVLACAGALFAGLVLGSHLSPYTRVSGFGQTGIPLKPSLLVALAVGALVLCSWLAALARARAKADPAAARLVPFLLAAGWCAVVVGGWAFSVFWTWTARLLGLRLGCTADELGASPLCRAPDAEADIARSVAAVHAFTPYSVLAVALMAVSLVVAGWSARPPRVRAWSAAVAAAAAVAATATLWQVGRVPAAPEVRLELRPVLDATSTTGEPPPRPGPAGRPSQDPDTQRRFAEFTCPGQVPNPTDPALPLLACSADGAEKYLLGPVELGSGDVADARAGFALPSGVAQVTITFTSADQWRELTTRHTDQRIAILVDDVVLVAPQIIEPLRDGTAVINGDFTMDEARSLARRITGR